MSCDDDYLFALRLQNELNADEEALAEWSSDETRGNKRKNDDDNDLNATQNIVNPEWEQLDPTPDIFSLFGAFDIKFFQGKLKCVELEWSKRMYQCAGICYQRRNALGMSIIIRLSEPLLKLRSRRDLIETMLHEMIHAYLFIQNIREGNGGHGPNFKRIMENINRVAGTNITVYHTFHDEVNLYKTHIWRCNGICQHRKPFYGWVKRTCNRAPGPNDNWWAKHHETCSGTFVKLSQPEPKNKAKKAKTEDNNTPKITNWLNTSKDSAMPKGGGGVNQPRTLGSGSGGGATGGYTKNNGGGTVVLKPTAKNRTATMTSGDDASRDSVLNSATVGGNLSNVVGFRDLNNSGTTSVIKQPSFASGGHLLGSSSSSYDLTGGDTTPSESVRNVWANKFSDAKKPDDDDASKAGGDNLPKNTNKTKVTESTSAWEEIDDDILIHSVQNTVIEIADDGSNSNGSHSTRNSQNNDEPVVPQHSTNETKPKMSIKRELLDDLGLDDENVEMIDDEFDDTLNESIDLLTDNSVIDEIFGTDTLMADFNNINNVVMSDPENVGNRDMEIVTCPICEDRMPRGELTCHLDGCNGITVKIEPRKRGVKTKPLPFYKNQAGPSTSSGGGSGEGSGGGGGGGSGSGGSGRWKVNTSEAELLRKAGYTKEAIDRLCVETDESRDYNDRIMDELARDERQRRTTSVIQEPPSQNADIETITLDGESSNSSEIPEIQPCPVCNMPIDMKYINEHLDECLS